MHLDADDIKAGLAVLATRTDLTIGGLARATPDTLTEIPKGVNAIEALWSAGIYLGRGLVWAIANPELYGQSSDIDPSSLRGLRPDDAVRALCRHDILAIEQSGRR